MKILLIYYSRTGTTRKAAQALAGNRIKNFGEKRQIKVDCT